jgi:AraC family transcriptional regulator
MKIDAECRVGVATTQVVRYSFDTPNNRIYRGDGRYRLDMSLTPRPNARACFLDTWVPHRFERLRRIVLIPAGAPLHVKSDCGRQSSVVCLLEKEAVREWFDGDLQWNTRRLEACLDIMNPSIEWLLSRLSEEMLHPGFASHTMIELIAVQLAIELQRYCTDISDGVAVGGLAPWRLRLIDERLKELPRAPSLQELADACGLSVRQLTRGFRATRGCSIGTAIAQSRIEHAKQLLSTDICVKSLAAAMGFASPSSFTYAFRRATGQAPHQFRQRERRLALREQSEDSPTATGCPDVENRALLRVVRPDLESCSGKRTANTRKR